MAGPAEECDEGASRILEIPLRHHHLLLALLVAACGAPSTTPSEAPAPAAAAPAASASASAAPADDPSEVVAMIGTDAITLATVDEAAGSKLVEARQQIYNARREALDQLVMERLVKAEATARGISEEELLKAEVEDKAAPVGEAEVSAFYEQNKPRMQGSLDMMAPRIQQFLSQQNKGQRMAAFSDELRGKAGVKVLLDPPRVEVDVPAYAPRKGSVDAPVQIIEFSDFQCPYCSKAAGTVDELVAKYGDRISIVFRHFPLAFHDKAQRAAEASACMSDQGKFWEYHDKLFAGQSDLSEPALERYAGEAGGDVAAFKLCMSAGEHAAKVKADLEAGSAVGVTGTPGFFINGRVVAGAAPLEQFTAIIDEELSRI